MFVKPGQAVKTADPTDRPHVRVIERKDVKTKNEAWKAAPKDMKPKEEAWKTAPSGDRVRTDQPQVEHKWERVIRHYDKETDREITLIRVTYQLPHVRAEALAHFLNQDPKVAVMEARAVGDSMTVTTTPEAQKVISQFVSFIQGARATGKHDTKTSNAPEEETRQFFRAFDLKNNKPVDIDLQFDFKDTKKPADFERKAP
jgi:hypothetical protein